MPELIAALDAFVQEHKRCGWLDSGVDGDVVGIACECGGELARSVESSGAQAREKQRRGGPP